MEKQNISVVLETCWCPFFCPVITRNILHLFLSTWSSGVAARHQKESAAGCGEIWPLTSEEYSSEQSESLIATLLVVFEVPGFLRIPCFLCRSSVINGRRVWNTRGVETLYKCCRCWAGSCSSPRSFGFEWNPRALVVVSACSMTRSPLLRGLIVYMWFNGCLFVAPALGSDSHCSGEDIYRTGSNVTPQIACRTSSGFYERSENGMSTEEVSDGRRPGGFAQIHADVLRFQRLWKVLMSAGDCVLTVTYTKNTAWLLSWESVKRDSRALCCSVLHKIRRQFRKLQKLHGLQTKSDQSLLH